MAIPEVVLEVRTKTGTCTGLLAELERTLRSLPPGSAVRAVVRDIPTRVDVLAWADRKGHRVVADEREGALSRLVIVRGEEPTPVPSRDAGP
jgi:TusA-related sulfurtransferase